MVNKKGTKLVIPKSKLRVRHIYYHQKRKPESAPWGFATHKMHHQRSL